MTSCYGLNQQLRAGSRSCRTGEACSGSGVNANVFEITAMDQCSGDFSEGNDGREE